MTDPPLHSAHLPPTEVYGIGNEGARRIARIESADTAMVFMHETLIHEAYAYPAGNRRQRTLTAF
jgi:hypothetical protein